jgi:hypothetical protein
LLIAALDFVCMCPPPARRFGVSIATHQACILFKVLVATTSSFIQARALWFPLRTRVATAEVVHADF